MPHATPLAAALMLVLGATPVGAFTFHCTGNACGVVSFLDEGVGCTAVTNHGRRPVHVTQGVNQLAYDLAPGETKAPLILARCYGYYDGGETATFIGPAR